MTAPTVCPSSWVICIPVGTSPACPSRVVSPSMALSMRRLAPSIPIVKLWAISPWRLVQPHGRIHRWLRLQGRGVTSRGDGQRH